MKILRIALRVLLGLIGLLALAVAVLITRGCGMTNGPVRRPVAELHVVSDSASIARGRHVAEMRCLGCHSRPDGEGHLASLPLSGGTVEEFENPLRLDKSVLVYPNLTPGGQLRDWSDGEIARAIREGIDKNGRPLVIMPSPQFRNLSDADLHALIAYLRSQPAMPDGPAKRHVDWFGYLGAGIGMFTTSVSPRVTQPVPEVEPGVTLEYGAYLGASLRCGECHGDGLHGADRFPDLHYYAAHQPESVFVRAVQRGIRSDGTPADPFMPSKTFVRITPDELSALYLWLKSTP